MLVGVCGLGYTGSGAVIDLLSEYDGLQVESNIELSFSYRPDGLEDLAYHLMNPRRFTACDVAISRFRDKMKKEFSGNPHFWGIHSFESLQKETDNFINSITQIRWKGFWTYDVSNYCYFKQRIYGAIIRLHRYLPKLALYIEKKLFYRDMYFSITPKDFYIKVRQYTNRILELLGYDTSRLIVINQLFSGDNPIKGFPFFDSPKAIVIDKDPRDLYISCKKVVKYDCAWVPTDDVKQFVEYYKSIRNQLYTLNDNNVLIVKFEDLIYNYEKEVSRIEHFLGISHSIHIKKKKVFNPDKSIANTQLFKRYPCYNADIKYIEENLRDFLFDYSKYDSVAPQGDAF